VHRRSPGATVLGWIGLWTGTTALPAQQAEYFDHPMLARYDVKVPLADGIRLSADLYLPAGGGRAPTVLELTPYNNNPPGRSPVDQAWGFVRRGYAYVVVDGRGRHDSEGIFEPFVHEGKDGNDLLSWVARQPWSNGRIATQGGSYTAWNQWLMARHGNPHHAAIVSYVAVGDAYRDWPNWDGVPKLHSMATWGLGLMFGRVMQSDGRTRVGLKWEKALWHLPVSELGRAIGRDVKYWRDWSAHETEDSYWNPSQASASFGKFDIPSFNVTGWWDVQVRSQIDLFERAVRHSKRPSDHMLIVGPWLHGVGDGSETKVGDVDYGRAAAFDLPKARDEWLDHQMLAGPRPARPAVSYFLMGKNVWKTADAFPIPGTRSTKYYLTSGGRANSLSGDGGLQTEGAGSGPADEYAYDPADPVPTTTSRTLRGGILPTGSVDNRAVEARQDVLVYTTPPLAAGLEITGRIKARVYVSTDVPDTDIYVKLLEVYPDGRAMNLSEGVARAKFRESFTTPSLLEPGKVYPVSVELYPLGTYVPQGNRIRIEITSSNFPFFARNLNTGRNSSTTTEMRVAHTKIHHSPEYPSHLVLPILP